MRKKPKAESSAGEGGSALLQPSRTSIATRAALGGQGSASRSRERSSRTHPVLLMDEPLSNLDALLRLHGGQAQASPRRVKRTTVYVTHDQIEALSMGDRIA